MESDHRPNPDAILERIRNEEVKSSRGQLRVFFGMCPGVGKTYAMLKSAATKRQAGARVVVGIVETHGRADTEAALAGFEIIPRRAWVTGTSQLGEMDLDRILELKPELVLVDELAHTNAPGSRHPKRYQDVQEILNAGIHVYTTLNVQHLESRADLVYQISGVPVRETVPDRFLEQASAIELIDLPPEELLGRMKAGKIYAGERADRAQENFFKLEKITALRELALRFTAERVDADLLERMQSGGIAGPWNAGERLLVAVSYSPSSARLIRSTRRMAQLLGAPWIALYVESEAKLESADHEMLMKNLNLARELGAEVMTTRERSISKALRRVASERNVTQIVMGRPDRRMFRDLFSGGNLLDLLTQETSEVDIHVIRQKRKPIYRGFHLAWPDWTSPFLSYLKTFLYLVACGFVYYVFRHFTNYQTIGFLLLLALLPVAFLAGLGPILFGAALSALIWNYFFIPPTLTFAISEFEDVMMIVAYFAVALTAGLLASRIRRQEADLALREKRANLLYRLIQKIADVRTEREIAEMGSQGIQEVLPCRAVVLGVSQKKLSPTPIGGGDPLDDKDFAVAVWSFEQGKRAGWKTDTLVSAKCLCVPLPGRSGGLGALVLFPDDLQRSLSVEQENLIDTIAGHLATALEREQFESASRKNEIYERSEKLHQALLNSVSHELRTPLTTLVGASSLLSKPGTESDHRQALLNDIRQASARLHHTIENLLDMSRISAGALVLKREFFDLGDFARSVVNRYSDTFGDRKIEWVVPDSGRELYLRADEKLLEHAFLNLLVNAHRYSPPDEPIQVRLEEEGARLRLCVRDFGPGVPDTELKKIFEPFHRVHPSADSGGVGLGLSIVKSIVEAHDGSVQAANRNPGAEFTLEFASETLPPEVLR